MNDACLRICILYMRLVSKFYGLNAKVSALSIGLYIILYENSPTNIFSM